MKIDENHLLTGVRQSLIPGGSPMTVRRFLVIHFTAGWTGASSIDFWKTPAAKGASAHIVIDRDGTITQCRPFNRTAGHAGVSAWTDPKTGKRYEMLNACSIGIELANCGDMGALVYPATMGPLARQPIPLIRARHKNGGPLTGWEEYPNAQLQAADEVGRLLVAKYNLDDVVGHEDIAPNRKNDPGPAFPMTQFRKALGFTAPLGVRV